MIDKLVRYSSSAATKLTVRSALNPLLWLCGIISLPCLLASSCVQTEGVRNALIALGGLPIVVTCCIAIGFAIFKPEKLQSEDYQLRHEALGLIQHKTGRGVLDTASVQAIANPQIPPPEIQ